jgi:Uma2 family endonuclease
MAATSGSHGIVQGRPFTVHDLETMPDDGRRYELLDGMLFVSPAPGLKHQKIVFTLAILLDEHGPEEWEVLPAPFAVRPSVTTELRPDVLVARDEDLTETHLPLAPVLAVEVLSPSTALHDRNSKKGAYERLRVGCYWVIDPQIPSLTAFELDDSGRYAQVAEVKRTDAFEAERPFPVGVIPAELLGRRREK